MAKHDESQKNSAGAYATILGAVVTIGAVVLSNKQVRNKVLKLISTGIDKLTTDEAGGIKDQLNKTAKKVESKARSTMEKMKDTARELADDSSKRTRKGIATR